VRFAGLPGPLTDSGVFRAPHCSSCGLLGLVLCHQSRSFRPLWQHRAPAPEAPLQGQTQVLTAVWGRGLLIHWPLRGVAAPGLVWRWFLGLGLGRAAFSRATCLPPVSSAARCSRLPFASLFPPPRCHATCSLLGVWAPVSLEAQLSLRVI
jgi:hypothetical protein